MTQEVVTGIRSRESLAEEGLDEDLEASISEYCSVIFNIKGRIGAAKMSVLTKNLEFIRIVYGGPRSEVVVIVMYVCQACGWAPKYDYDYWVVPGEGGCAIWCCAKFCGMYDKTMMNCAFGIIYNKNNKKD